MKNKLLLLFSLFSTLAMGQTYPPVSMSAQNPSGQIVSISLDVSSNLFTNGTGSAVVASALTGYIPPVAMTGQAPGGSQVYLKTDVNGNLYVSCQAGCGGGGAGTTNFPLTMNNSGSGATSGTTFNGGTSGITISYNTIGAAPVAGPTFTGTTTIPALVLSSITGSTQCLQVNNSGAVSGSAAACGTGSTTNALTANNSGSGAASGTTFNGGSPITISYNTIGAAPIANPTFTGTVIIPALTLSGVTGSTQCLQANTSGVLSGTGASCGGTVTSVSNSDGTLIVSPTTGLVSESLNTAHTNTWTVLQTFGNMNAMVQNGVSICSNYSGSTVDQQVNNCLADAMALTNGNTSGIADASGLGGGNFTTTAQITVGNASGVGVKLILPCKGKWYGSMTDGTSDTLKQYGGSTIEGCPASGLAAQFVITATSGSNLRAIYEVVTATNPYIYAKGFNVNNTGGHITATGIGMFFNGPMNDGSTFDAVNVNDSLDTYCAEAYNVSAATTWKHSAINCQNHGTPFYALTDSGGYVQSMTLTDMTITHAGTGLPEIRCDDTRSATPHISFLNLDQIYTETGTDGTTTQLQDNGCGAISVNDWIIKSQSSGSTAPGITVSNAYNTNLSVKNMLFRAGSGNFTYPINAIVNNFTSETKATDSLGNYELYTPPTMPSSLGVLTAASITDTGVTGSTQCAQFSSSGVLSGTGAACGAGGSSGISGLTAGYIPIAGTATTITANSHMDDGITTASTITSTENIVAPQVSTNGAGVGGFGAYNAAGTYYTLYESVASGANNIFNAPATTPVNGDILYAATSGNTTTMTDSNIPYSSLPLKIANGTAALTTSAITAGNCTVTTVAASGVATTDIIISTANGDPTATTGYVPSSSGSLFIWAYPTANNVNFKVCNPTTGTITPGALTLNWKVTR